MASWSDQYSFASLLLAYSIRTRLDNARLSRGEALFTCRALFANNS